MALGKQASRSSVALVDRLVTHEMVAWHHQPLDRRRSAAGWLRPLGEVPPQIRLEKA
jgi:hypothetical protein